MKDIDPEFLESLGFIGTSASATSRAFTYAATDEINIIVMLFGVGECEAFLRFVNTGAREIPHPTRDSLKHLVLGFPDDGRPDHDA